MTDATPTAHPGYACTSTCGHQPTSRTVVGPCRSCGEPDKNCPNSAGEACCLVCYGQNAIGVDWHVQSRFTVNPDPVAVVDEKHEGSAYKGVTRERRRNAWIATGNDPALFDAENPPEQEPAP